MSTENNVREVLREWLADKNIQLSAHQIDDDFPLLKERVITSLQVTDLLIFIESLRGKPVSIQEITPGAFGSINAICDHFFKEFKACV